MKTVSFQVTMDEDTDRPYILDVIAEYQKGRDGFYFDPAYGNYVGGADSEFNILSTKRHGKEIESEGRVDAEIEDQFWKMLEEGLIYA